MTANSVQFSPFVDGYCDVENQFLNNLLRKAETLFLKEKQEKDSIRSREDFEKRKKRIQEYFIKALGGLPEEKTPLNAQVKGLIEKEQYRIEKVIFESFPRFYVTSLLYLPKKLDAPAPGILFCCGHARTAKAYPRYQKVCIDLVKNGFVVLAVDPIGQGERLQYWDPESKSELVRWGTTEHSYFGSQCILIGDNIARYFIWDGIRGIDYLVSRPEVDGECIGVTGNSGGGTQSSYLMMTEPRIKAAAPCTYITSIDALIKTIGPQDSEQNIFGAIKEGMNHDDYIATFAPKPVLIGAAAYDFFAIEGTIRTFKMAKRIYRLYDAEENIALHIGKHTHMYSDELREAVVNWFRRHLKGEPPSFKTGDVKPEPEDSLNVTRTGQILGEIPDARTVFDLNLEHWTVKKPKRPVINTVDEMKQYSSSVRWKLRRLLNITEERTPIYPRVISTVDWNGLKAEKLFFFSEPDVTLTAVMIYDEDSNVRTAPMLALFEHGTHDIPRHAQLIKGLVAAGNKVLVLDFRGIGGVQARKLDRHGTEYRLVYIAYLLGTSLVGMRTYDVLRGIDYLRLRDDVDFGRLGLYAKGQAAVYGLFAAVLSSDVQRVALEDLLCSYENVVKTKIYRRNPIGSTEDASRLSLTFESVLVNGILEHLDIIDLLPLLWGRTFKFINPRNAKREITSLSELRREWFDVARENYPLLGNLEENVLFTSSLDLSPF